MEVLDLAFAPLKWLGSFWTHQTHIRLVRPPVIQESKPPALPVHDAGKGGHRCKNNLRDAPPVISEIPFCASDPLRRPACATRGSLLREERWGDRAWARRSGIAKRCFRAYVPHF